MKKTIQFLLVILLIFGLIACDKNEPKDPIDPIDPVDGNPTAEELRLANPKNDVYYQIFVRSFADSNDDGIGDLKGITENVDYLVDLGVTAVWLLPIHPSPSYHGYDVMDYLAINPQYGTMADFEEMIETLEDHDIKIIIDLVINHTSDQHPWFISANSSSTSPYRDYYIWNNGNAYESFVGGMKDLNFRNEKVIDEIKSIMDFYLEKGIHGFRIDAAKHLIEGTNVILDNSFLLLELNNHIKDRYPNSFIVSEVFDYYYQMVTDYYIGSDSAFNFFGAEQIWSKVGKLESRYLLVSNLIKAYNSFREIKEDFVDSPFLTNHDLDRLASMPGFMNDIPKQKLAAHVLLTLPGSPFIYYGEELGMKGYRDYSQDGFIVPGYGIAYDEFRRTPFLWGESDQMTTWFPNTMNDDTLTLSEQKLDANSLFSTYQTLIRLRKDNPALMYGNQFIPYKDNTSLIQGYIRHYEFEDYSQTLLIVHNLTTEIQTIDVDGTLIYGSQSINPYGTVIIEINEDQIEDLS